VKHYGSVLKQAVQHQASHYGYTPAKVFTSVFKNKSFSKASEELHLTQPTISNHIKALEDEFDCKLFDRLGRTILPTKEAEVLYSHSLKLLKRWLF